MIRKIGALFLAVCIVLIMAGVAMALETVQPQAEPVTEVKSTGNAVYVSEDGNDENGEGTAEKPYATLAKAVGAAKDGDTIYVMSNLTVTSCARFYNMDLTITSGDGGPYTLTRGDDFEKLNDPARRGYNPAMIEVGSDKAEGSGSLTLSNIILDDLGEKEGKYFIQADSEGDGKTAFGSMTIDNLEIVQDAIIATYHGNAKITLEDGAILKNYGGMSAVRVSGGTLTMEAGSKIIDDNGEERSKGETITGAKTELYGPAGAVWIQGGTLTMNGGVIGGADGVTMNGRAVYVDSGTANIGGTIQNIKGTDAAWQGQNGVAVHLRGGAEAKLTSTGKITNVTGTNAGNNTAIWTQFCNFTAEKGSHISEVNEFQLLYFDDLDNNNYSHEVYLDGIISDCAAGSASLIRSWYGQITFGPNSVIEGCSSSSAGGLIYSNNGSHYTFAGTIRNNKVMASPTTSPAIIYLANQSGGGVIATIEDTAHIVDNSGGPAVRVNNSSNLTMKGGEIARNSSYGVQVSAKDNWKGVKFIMNGGSIHDNGGVGVDATIGGNAVTQLNGGSIYGNGDGTEVQVWNDYTDSKNAYADSTNDHLYIADGVLQGDRTVKVMHGYGSFLGAISLNRTLGTVTLDEGHGAVGLAFANPKAVDKITELVTAEKEREKWKAAGQDAYWIKPNASSYHFKVTRPSDATKTDLYLAYIPMNDDGSVPDDAKLTLKKVGTGNQIDVTMDGLDAGKAYAFMFVNSSEYTLAADDITKYIGGGSGSETAGNGFPELTISDSVDEITKLEIEGAEIEGGNLLDELLKNIEAVYTYEDSTVATDDSKSGEYTVTLKWKNGFSDNDVRINGNNVNLDGEGTLIVRHTSDVTGAQDGTTTHKLLEPTAPVEHATATAKKGGCSGTTEFYTNNNEDYVVGADGIRLLDDSLLLEGDDNRQELMEQKAAEYLGAPGEGRAYRYEFHYLNLVDAFNGNAWVSASNGTTIYLPYPEGVTADNADELGVKVVHYKGLHREYGIAGQADVEDAIAASELETMEENVKFTPNGIKFDVPRAGFSPFAVVWQTEAHTIIATAGAGGSIDPEGEIIVAKGADQTFTFTPDAGYTLDTVTVDGQPVPVEGNSYTISNVNSNMTIHVTFKSNSGGGGSGGGSGSTHVTTDRIGGDDRFETAVKVAERLKSKLGVKKFDTIIVADSDDFADALSAEPLASEKDAPILVVNERNEKYVKEYIDENLASGGRVYIIGETAAVSEDFEESLEPHKVTRLGGADRYETNLKVLKELNLKGQSEIMVASGQDYPDALSASATGNPILLVKSGIFDYQKDYLETLGGDDDYFVIGGTAAVNEKVMDQLEKFDEDGVSRVWGDDRFETAKAVADRFYRNARAVYIASGCDFPDALTGGVIAYKNNAPLLLVSESKYSEAARFVDTHNVRKVTAIGGPAAVSDKVLRAVAR